jgi:hypothetical protein
MKSVCKLFLPLAIAALPLMATADSWKDESGHGRGHGYGHGHDRHEYKEEYWDGNCKIERKLEKSGEYKEERKCRAPRQGHYRQGPAYMPVPPPVVVHPGVTIQPYRQ